MAIRILYLGEIVGRPGIFCLKSKLNSLKKEFGVNFTIANGDGATNGFGLGKSHAAYLRKLGVDVVTGGDQIFYKKDMVPVFDSFYHVLRPANLPPEAPGRGFKVYTVGQTRIAVINLLGMNGFPRMHVSNPYLNLPDIVRKIQSDTPNIILDFHSVTTAEKVAMGMYADGKLSAVFGSGLRTLCADGAILPGGTATISDCGRTGSLQSVAGFEPAQEIEQFISGIPGRSNECWDGLEIQGALVELADNGKATYFETIRIPVMERPSDTTRDSNED